MPKVKKVSEKPTEETEPPASPSAPEKHAEESLRVFDPPGSEGEPAASSLSLEERVRRLEDALAALQANPQADTEPAAGPTSANESALATPPLTFAPLPPPARPWLLRDIYAELRVIPRMFFDPRYSLSWATKIVAPLLIILIILTRWLVSDIVAIGGILDFVFLTILFYILFKVLSREATRYRTTSPDLPQSWRL